MLSCPPSALDRLREHGIGPLCVTLRAERLRDALVGGIANQHVAEPEGVLDRLVRTDELPANERRELRTGGPSAVRSELSERIPLELEPDHGGALEQPPLLGGQGVEASGEQCLYGCGHVPAVAASC